MPYQNLSCFTWGLTFVMVGSNMAKNQGFGHKAQFKPLLLRRPFIADYCFGINWKPLEGLSLQSNLVTLSFIVIDIWHTKFHKIWGKMPWGWFFGRHVTLQQQQYCFWIAFRWTTALFLLGFIPVGVTFCVLHYIFTFCQVEYGIVCFIPSVYK